MKFMLLTSALSLLLSGAHAQMDDEAMELTPEEREEAERLGREEKQKWIFGDGSPKTPQQIQDEEVMWEIDLPV